MCGDIQFVSREKWEAKQPKNTEHMPTPVSIVFVHHTMTASTNQKQKLPVVAMFVNGSG
jgi:hypothetical protein